MTDNKEIPIPDVITRVGIENLGKRVTRKGLICTDEQLQKLFIVGLIMFIICSIGIALLIAFPPQTNYGLVNWAVELAICIGFEIVGLMIILAYILRREGFKRFLTKGRIKFAERKAEMIEKK